MASATTDIESNVELDALARAYGIESDFEDARGIRRRTTAQTQRRLLAAMGVRAATAADVRAAQAERDAEEWTRALPPVIVGAAARGIDVPLVLPATAARCDYRVALEAGATLRATSDVAALPLLGWREVAGQRLERRSLRLTDLPLGYHRIAIAGEAHDALLIVTPEACWLPPAIVAGERLSGIALSLYLLRSATNWGIGDFSDLRALVDVVAGNGADVIGLNPLHQQFLDDPEHASPYSPASRLLLNVLTIDLGAIPEFAASADVQRRFSADDAQAALGASRAAARLDYSAVARLKREFLSLTYAAFLSGADDERRADFAAFRAAATPAVERTFLFTALREWFAATSPANAAWQRWPPEYREPASPAVARFAAEHADALTFVAWQQWIADTQLAAAAQAALPMRVGLYRDLAVGADPAGAETWCNAHAVVSGARIGAPPDIFNPPGQNWDLPPFDPHALRLEGYASFIELLRANMRHAGALRIDHVMALQHAYWIPQGAAPADGAYVAYPLEDLLGILALESHRARCLIVGEDLGTVPAGFRERMERANVLSYRVLFFERTASGAFAPPTAYPRAAVAVAGNHDLATLAAWWDGADIDLRERLGLVAGPAAVADARATRADDRVALVAALRDAGSLGADETPSAETLVAAVHAVLAQTPAALVLAQLDDLTAEVEPVNVPTTSDERPNWRRRLSISLEEVAHGERLARLLAILRDAGRLRARM
jgi:4-alpha-glucanotransferase